MKSDKTPINRKEFIKNSSLLTLGAGSLVTFPTSFSAMPKVQAEGINIIGPKNGYSPQIGTLVSMMDWMRMIILNPVKDMSVEDLDYLVDENANSIGAMLWHLASTERFYQLHTFEGIPWGEWPESEKKEWGTASGLGDEAREKIKGNDLDFYLKKLEDTRSATLEEFKKRDDDWLMAVDEDWFWGPTNNYCKWFHVCEHESNHNGQFKFIKSRLPSAQK
ncbi:MAG TPA: DinB family protein [Cryomorphaceae bacterium]|nr:DinB family protein [Cryomorphaceae bacterium]